MEIVQFNFTAKRSKHQILLYEISLTKEKEAATMVNEVLAMTAYGYDSLY